MSSEYLDTYASTLEKNIREIEQLVIPIFSFTFC